MAQAADGPRMKVVHAILFILAVNRALDTGKYDHITQEEVKHHIEAGDLIPWLVTVFGEHTELGFFTQDGLPYVGEELTRRLRRGLNVWGGDERRKWGLENRGLCLLIGWTNELIQQEFGEVRFGDDFYDPSD